MNILSILSYHLAFFVKMRYHDPLQYILIDGEFAAVSVGHYRYGPYEIHDIVCGDPARARKNDVIAAVQKENGAIPMRFDGQIMTTES